MIVKPLDPFTPGVIGLPDDLDAAMDRAEDENCLWQVPFIVTDFDGRLLAIVDCHGTS